MKNKTPILITGGSGFIGFCLVKKMIKEGYHVTVIDIWQSLEMEEYLKTNKNLKFIKQNLIGLTKNDASDLIREHDCIVHLAGILGTSETITTYNILDVVETNLIVTIKLLEAICKTSKKIIIPLSPDVSWMNPYKITKRAIEDLSYVYAKEKDVNCIRVRLGNVFGPGERWLDADKSQNFQSAPYNYQKIIPTFIMDALADKPVTIYGDGKQRSEYIFSEDVSEILVRLISSEKKINGLTVDVGRGKNYSVLEIIETIEKVWGRKIDKHFVNMRPGENENSSIVLNPDNLKKYLDYQLTFSLKMGLKKTIPYYENNT